MKNKELMLANLRYMQEVVDAQKQLSSIFRHTLKLSFIHISEPTSTY